MICLHPFDIDNQNQHQYIVPHTDAKDNPIYLMSTRARKSELITELKLVSVLKAGSSKEGNKKK